MNDHVWCVIEKNPMNAWMIFIVVEISKNNYIFYEKSKLFEKRYSRRAY
jgi:hypothetical protein